MRTNEMYDLPQMQFNPEGKREQARKLAREKRRATRAGRRDKKTRRATQRPGGFF